MLKNIIIIAHTLFDFDIKFSRLLTKITKHMHSSENKKNQSRNYL